METQAAPLYVFSRGEGKGFVIVSGDDCLPEVLAVVEQGDWDEASLPPALLDWVEGYTDLIEEAQEAGMPARQPRKATGTRSIPQLCQTHWNQGWPYNNRCPWRNDDPNSRCLTGCVATAASQVVYYWHRDNPDRSGYATPTYSYGSPVTESVPKGTPLRWDLMQANYGSSTPAEMQSAVADLMFITGSSTWLTYGSSTSGQINDLVNTFSGQYNLNSTCWYKAGNSQTYWEQLIIADLEAGRPIVYSGVHPSNGGHAVVVDGYNHTNNLFHFNFGWGGQGDGWYTVDDQTGMNGFNSQQGMTFRIYPKAYNVSAKILTPAANGTFMQRVDNTVKVSFTNHSTIPQTGVYLFCLSGTSRPTSIDKATRRDESTVIPVDGTAVLNFDFKPTLATSVYTLYVTDANCTVLDKVEGISVQATATDLMLKDISVNGASQAAEQITADGKTQNITVQTVYNSNARVTAQLINGNDGTLCQPSLSCELATYDATAGFVKSTSKSSSTTIFERGETRNVDFAFSRLKEDVLYRAKLVPVGSADIEGSDVMTVYFRVKAADLTVISNSETESVLSGHWNDEVFANLAVSAATLRYDLTQVVGNVNVSTGANPNALFYVNSTCTAQGNNIIQDGICQQLVVVPGFSFAPKAPFKAKKASLTAPAGISTWNLLQLPFECVPPTGTFARLVNGYNSLGAINKADSVSSPIIANAEYLLMSSFDEVTLSNTDCTIPATEMTVLFTNDVKVSTTYTTKDTQNKKLAESIATAELRLNELQAETGSEAQKALRTVINDAKQTFTNQPFRDDLKSMITTLDNALETFEASHYTFTPDGKVDMTGLLLNPSFESGTSKWTIKKPSGITSAAQSITSSQANYMSGADGDKILYLSYKANTENAYFFQTLQEVPEGTYELKADLASERGCHVTLFANADTLTVEATDFGPCYFTTVTISDIQVKNGILTIGAMTHDGWLKADNFRLYQTDGAIIANVDHLDAEAGNRTDENVTYGIDGRRYSGNRLPRGIYVRNGRKFVIH